MCLAQCYEHGRWGLKRDDAEAVRLYTLAARQGDAEAQAHLGVCHERGRGGLQRDVAEAVRLSQGAIAVTRPAR